MKMCFWSCFQNVSVATILITRFQKRCILDYQKFHTLEIWKSFHRRVYTKICFCYCFQNDEMLRKIIFLPNNLVPFPKSVQIKCPFSNPISVLFDLSKFLMKMCQRHCSHSPRGAGGWAGCAGALGSSCIDTTLLPGVWNWTTGKDPGL